MSKLNPQKASAYVGKGVLRKGGKITPVPNGPLIKKKGPYAGSTLKTGGTIKKAQTGDTLAVKKPMTYAEKRAAQQLVREKNIRARDSVLNRNAAARGMTRAEVQAQQEKDKKKPDQCVEGLRGVGKDNEGCSGSAGASARRVKREARRKNGGPVKKALVGTGIFKNNPIYKKSTQARGMIGKLKGLPGAPIVKNGDMIKRADGSYSKRGLWDNIRANKGSGKKPTKQMLVQERKIKAKSKK